MSSKEKCQQYAIEFTSEDIDVQHQTKLREQDSQDGTVS